MLALLVLPLAAAPLGAFGARHALYTLPWANTVSWCGVALVAAGLWLRIAAMARLGRRFSPLVALQKDHVLETGGPYAFVRHPGYLGALLACLGAAIAFGSALALPLPAPCWPPSRRASAARRRCSGRGSATSGPATPRAPARCCPGSDEAADLAAGRAAPCGDQAGDADSPDLV